MPNELLSRAVSTQTLDVKTVQRLTGLSVAGDHFSALYAEERQLSDGTVLPARNFTVDRSISTLGSDVTAWLAQGAAFAELWRQADDDAKVASVAAVAAEAVRWAALTPTDRQAEVAAAKADAQAAIDASVAANGLLDPTPTGPALSANLGPVSLAPAGP